MDSSKFSSHQVKTFQKMVKEAILSNDTFRAKLFLIKIGKLPPHQQRQVMRYLLDFFLLKSRNFTYELIDNLKNKAGYSRYLYRSALHTIQIILANRVIEILMTLEEEGKFVPQKVFTISKLPKFIQGLPPESFNFLFSKGIIELGKSFTMTPNNPKKNDSFSVSIDNETRFYTYLLSELNDFVDIISSYGILPDMLFDNNKRRIFFITNFSINILTLLEYNNKVEVFEVAIRSLQNELENLGYVFEKIRLLNPSNQTFVDPLKKFNIYPPNKLEWFTKENLAFVEQKIINELISQLAQSLKIAYEKKKKNPQQQEPDYNYLEELNYENIKNSFQL